MRSSPVVVADVLGEDASRWRWLKIKKWSRQSSRTVRTQRSARRSLVESERGVLMASIPIEENTGSIWTR
jgi:hypothetical protein